MFWALALNEEFESFERNEFEFWSFWVDKAVEEEKLLMISSSYFEEHFFNRAFLLDCNFESHMGALNSFFTSDYCVTINDSCNSFPAGFEMEDRMLVLEMKKTPQGRYSSTVIDDRVEEWSRVYLESFYGDTRLIEGTIMSVERALASGRVKLLAYLEGERIVGVSALYSSGKLVGMYCVGTLKEHRKKGIASDMIRHASSIALKEGKRLVLQTLESDSLLNFYSSNGFSLTYTKTIYTKKKGV